MNDERCKQHVYGPREMQGHLCNKPVWKDGYCKIHHPDNVEARQAARDAKRDAEWAAQDKADAKSKCIERAERKVLKAAEARRDAGLCGHEDETQRATQHLLEVAVDRLKAARKHFQEFDMLYDYCYHLSTGQQTKVNSLATLLDREREEAVKEAVRKCAGAVVARAHEQMQVAFDDTSWREGCLWAASDIRRLYPEAFKDPA